MSDQQTNPVPPQPAPPAWDADINERIAGFNAALAPLLGKYELGLAAIPRIAPNGLVVADPILVSQRKPPVEAPPAPEAPKPAEKKGKLSKAD